MVVRRERRRQGIGRALVTDFEERVREHGAITVWLGTDDVDARTSLAGVASSTTRIRCMERASLARRTEATVPPPVPRHPRQPAGDASAGGVAGGASPCSR